MSILLTSKVNGLELTKLIAQHFPILREEIEENDGLVHIQMGSLECLANTSIKSGDLEILKQIYEFVSDLARHEKELEPSIINAINVSFLEGLNCSKQKPRESSQGFTS